MFDVDINYWAILVSAVSSMVIGFLWYAPQLFGKAWMATFDKTPEEMKKDSNNSMYLWAFALALVEAFVLAHVISYVDAVTVWEGVLTGFWMWLGFVVTVNGVNAIFERTPMTRVWINLGNHLLYLVVAGAILAVWV